MAGFLTEMFDVRSSHGASRDDALVAAAAPSTGHRGAPDRDAAARDASTRDAVFEISAAAGGVLVDGQLLAQAGTKNCGGRTCPAGQLCMGSPENCMNVNCQNILVHGCDVPGQVSCSHVGQYYSQCGIATCHLGGGSCTHSTISGELFANCAAGENWDAKVARTAGAPVCSFEAPGARLLPSPADSTPAVAFAPGDILAPRGANLHYRPPGGSLHENHLSEAIPTLHTARVSTGALVAAVAPASMLFVTALYCARRMHRVRTSGEERKVIYPVP